MIARVLIALLLAQLALVAWLYWPGTSQVTEQTALLAGLERSALEHIIISSSESDTIRLNRNGDRWTLESGLPVDPGKVARLLDALLGADPGFAVAQSDSAAERFAVSADRHERKILLKTAQSETIAYLGSSPAFRKIHARREGDTGVFVLELNNYDAPTDANSWLDQSLLAIGDQQNMTLNGVAFRLEQDGWRRDDGELADSDAMERLLQALAGLRVTGIEQETPAQAGVVLTLAATAASDAQESTLEILEDTEAQRYFLRSNRFEPVFATSAYDAERILDAAQALR